MSRIGECGDITNRRGDGKVLKPMWGCVMPSRWPDHGSWPNQCVDGKVFNPHSFTARRCVSAEGAVGKWLRGVGPIPKTWRSRTLRPSSYAAAHSRAPPQPPAQARPAGNPLPSHVRAMMENFNDDLIRQREEEKKKKKKEAAAKARVEARAKARAKAKAKAKNNGQGASTGLRRSRRTTRW